MLHRRYGTIFAVYVCETYNPFAPHVRSRRAVATHTYTHSPLRVNQLGQMTSHRIQNIHLYKLIFGLSRSLACVLRTAYVNYNLNAILTQQIVKWYLSDLQINLFVWSTYSMALWSGDAKLRIRCCSRGPGALLFYYFR